jgi:hypothetical protein
MCEQSQVFSSVILMLALCLSLGCHKDTVRPVNMAKKEPPATQPAEAVQPDEHDTRQLPPYSKETLTEIKSEHEYIFKKRLRIIVALNEITARDSRFSATPLSKKDENARNVRIYKLVDGLKGDVDDLLTFAEMCVAMRLHKEWEMGSNFGPNPYLVAFFHIVRIVATEYKDNDYILSRIKDLSTRLGSHPQEDFQRALEGLEPRDL